MSRWWWLGATCGVLLLACAAVWWPVAQPAVPVRLVAPATPTTGATPATPAGPPGTAPAALATAHVAAAAPPPGAPCAGSSLTLRPAAGRQPVCLAPARLSQSGDVRTWQAGSVPAGWQLEVVLSGDEVLAVHLSAPGMAVARCEASACNGIVLGPRDAHGARRLHLRQVGLLAGEDRWQADAVLTLPAAPDESACEETGIAVTASDGAAWRFCASASAVAALGPGDRVFHLRSMAGDVLRVALAADGTLDEIALGPQRCQRWQCNGAALEPADDGSLVLRLDGVPLQGIDATRHAALRLQGRLVLPPS